MRNITLHSLPRKRRREISETTKKARLMSISTGAELSRGYGKRSRPYSLKDVETKIWIVKHNVLSLPNVLLGKKIRITIIEDKK